MSKAWQASSRRLIDVTRPHPKKGMSGATKKGASGWSWWTTVSLVGLEKKLSANHRGNFGQRGPEQAASELTSPAKTLFGRNDLGLPGHERTRV